MFEADIVAFKGPVTLHGSCCSVDCSIACGACTALHHNNPRHPITMHLGTEEETKKHHMMIIQVIPHGRGNH